MDHTLSWVNIIDLVFVLLRLLVKELGLLLPDVLFSKVEWQPVSKPLTVHTLSDFLFLESSHAQ